MKMKSFYLMTMMTAFAVSFALVSCGSDDDEDSSKPNARTAYTVCPNDNHPHLIDLGLPSGTKWACCNVGASAPEEYGNYYRWAETTPVKKEDTDDTYLYYEKEFDESIAGTSYDVATANWGAPWKMPTDEQIRELLHECSYEWTSQNEINGVRITGRNGGSIFFPVSGKRDFYCRFIDINRDGYYWSATESDHNTNSDYAIGMYLGLKEWNWMDFDRNDGHSVRAVVE